MALPVNMLFRIVPIVVTGALGTFAYLRARMAPRFPYMGRPLSNTEYAGLANLGWRMHGIRVGSGVELRCLIREAATPDAPWVLFFNGNSPHMLSEGRQVLHAMCAERGWGGVVWAYRGFDSSSGTPTPGALEEDGFEAYRQLLTQRGIAASMVHLVGFSLGTGVAAAVAGRAHEDPPASLTLLAPFTRIYLGNRMQPWLHRYETLKWLQKVRSPTLVVHGARDDTLDIEHGRAVAAALGPRGRLLEMPDLGHHELPFSPAVQQAMQDFISQHAATRDRVLQ